jgi:imidazolonepropionase-like amidohydrolase
MEVRMRRVAVAVVAGALACVVPGLAQPAGKVVVVRAGHVIDPGSGRVLENQIVIVKDDRIAEIGAGLAIPAGAEVIDLSRSWVLPGLMDAHVHLTLGVGKGQDIFGDYLREGSPLRSLRGAHNARLVLEAGFTAVKDIGNDASYAAVAIRQAIGRGWTPGPRMLTTGKIIAPFGGQSGGVPPEMGPFWRFEYIDADTPDEIRKGIRENIYYGANAIKLVADNSAFNYSQADIEAAVDEAHRAGVTVAVHVMGGQAARNVILGGADSIEHGFDLDEALLRLMVEKGTWLVGTEFPEDHLQDMGYGAVQDGKTLGQRLVERLRLAHKLGVKLAFGTDVILERPGQTRADMMLDYLAVWTAAGIPAMDTLKALTANVADLFGWKDRAGAVAPGKWADLIATPSNPLDDLQALRRVHFVMKGGQVVRNDRK